MADHTEETQAPSGAVPAGTPSTPAPPPEPSKDAPAAPTVDYHRILDDEDYAPPVEQDQAGTPTSKSEPGEKAEAQPAPAGEAAAAATTAAPVVTYISTSGKPDDVVERIMVEGKEYDVTRAQSKALHQKGFYMERRFERIAPLLAIEREAPELIELWRNPEERRKALERLRQKDQPAAPKPTAKDGEEREEVDPRDLDLIDQRAVAAARQLLERAGIRIPEPADIERERAELQQATLRVQSTFEALRDTDPEYNEAIAAVRELVAEAERTQPRDKFLAFRAAVDNPRNLHPESGKPLFVHLYHDARNWVRARKAQQAGAASAADAGSAPAAATAATPRRSAGTITATLEPGSPAPRAAAGRPSGSPDFSHMSAAERTKYFNDLVDGSD